MTTPEDPVGPALTGRRGSVQGGLWLAASNLIPLAATLVLSVVMGRALGPEELGAQSYIAYLASLLTSLLVSTTTDMSFRVLGRTEGTGDLARRNDLRQWLVIGQGLGTVVVAGLLLGIGGRSDEQVAWLLVAATVLVDGVFWARATSLIVRDGWGQIARARLVSLTSSAALGTLAVLSGMGIEGVFAANLVAAAGLLAWTYGKEQLPRMRPLSQFPRPLVGIWWAFLVMGGLSQVVSYRIEFLFLGALSSDSELAMYSIGFMVVSTALSLPKSIISAALPVIAAHEGAGRIREAIASLEAATRMVLLAGCLISAAVAATGPAIVAMAYGPDYLEAASLVPLLAIGIVPAAVAELYWAFARGVGRNRIPIIAATLAGVVDLGLALALVGPYGALGAAIANVGAQLVLVVAITWISLRQFEGLRLRLGTMLSPALASLVIGGICLTIVDMVGYDSELRALAALVAGGCAFLLLTVFWGRLVGFVSRSDAEWLRASLPTALGRLVPLISGRTGRHSTS